jgi:F-type H+-transporting ATPase subunit b
MNFGRFFLVFAIVCAVGSLRAADAWAQHAESKLEHVEDELEKAAHSDPSHGNSDSDPLSVDPDLALWTLIIFLILLAVLGKFAWGPIIQSLEAREHGIAEHIAQAQRNHEEARRVLAEYEQKLAAAAAEVRALMEEARRDAEQAKQGILADAKTGADAERVRALRDIESAADQAMESLAKRSADLAVDLAGKILQTKLSKDEHARLIQEAMSKFPTNVN